MLLEFRKGRIHAWKGGLPSWKGSGGKGTCLGPALKARIAYRKTGSMTCGTGSSRLSCLAKATKSIFALGGHGMMMMMMMMHAGRVKAPSATWQLGLLGRVGTGLGAHGTRRGGGRRRGRGISLELSFRDFHLLGFALLLLFRFVILILNVQVGKGRIQFHSLLFHGQGRRLGSSRRRASGNR